MTDTEIERVKQEINKLTQSELAWLWRHSPAGHQYFRKQVFGHFQARFESLGGFTPTISKAIDG